MIRTSLVVAALLVASGCTPHRIQYYQISTAVKPTVPVETGPVLVVGHIATPLALQDGRIRYHAGLNEVGAYEYHRWTDPPGIMVKDALIYVLRASGKFKSVQETSSSVEGDYSLRGKLIEFSEVDTNGIATRVSLDLELRDVKTGQLVWTQAFTHDDPVQAKTVADVVASLDRNLQVVLGNASADLGTYVAAHPVTR